MRVGGVSAVGAIVLLGGCSIIPDVPPDFALPVQEILHHTACELQRAFQILSRDPTYKRFKAGHWLVTIALTPKVDTDANVSGGFTRKNPWIGNPDRYVTWNVSGPGIQLDAKGERTSGINYTFKSNELMKDKTLVCMVSSPSIHALAQHLGVGEWLARTAAAMNVASSTGIDKPSFNSDITVKFAGNGSYTYTFPPGSNLATFGGSYTLDEQLNISMAPIADKQTLTVTTLPLGDEYSKPVTSNVAVQVAQNRLDLQAIETAIRKLQPSQ